LQRDLIGDRQPFPLRLLVEIDHRQVAADAVASDKPRTIVSAKSPQRRGRLGDVPDMTPDEYERRCNAADALFRELVRQATGKQ
jgi:hypothetical protein